MDPLANQAGVSRGVKPVLALTNDLGAVLREGRVLAGEVLQTLGGKSLLIGVGSHRVPANSSVELQLGDRFLARVEQTEEGTILKVLGERGKGELRLVTALKQVLGEDRPVGKLLGDLASKLRAALAQDGEQREVRELFEKLGKHVFLPGADAADLRALLARSGLDFEALLLAEDRGGKAAALLRVALGNLVKQIIGALGELWTGAGLQAATAQLESLGGRLLLALAGLDVGASGESREAMLARLVGEIRSRLEAAIASSTSGQQRETALAGLKDLLSKLLGEKGKSPLVKNLLTALLSRGDSSALEGNLKGELLKAVGEMGKGPIREALLKALAGIESEQLLNLARREFQEGWHLSVPVPDGEAWATAHLFYSDPDGAPGGSRNPNEDMQRITVSVDFSRIGPLRAEIGVREDLVALRLVVSDAKVAERLRGEAQELVQRLESGGRKVRVAVVVGEPEDLGADALTYGVRWLREHHLMDLSG